MLANLEDSTVATGQEKVSFRSNPKERQCQRMFKLPHNCTHLICQQSESESCSVMSNSLQPMEFSRPEYWSGKPFPSPGGFPNPGIEPRSPILQVHSLPGKPQGKATCQKSNAQNSLRQASTVCEPRTSRCSSWIRKRQRNQRSIWKHPFDNRKSRRVPEKTSTCASLTILKPLTVWIMTNWKIFKEVGIPDHLTCLLRILFAGQEPIVKIRQQTMDWFQIGKGIRQDYIVTLLI